MGISLSDLPRFINSWAALQPHAGRAFWPEVVRRAFVVAICLGLAVLVRALLGSTNDVAPFATFYPAIGIAALLAGFWAGIATIGLSWLAAWYFFFGAIGFTPLTQSQVVGSVVFFFSALVLLLTAVWLRDTIMRLEHSAARYRALIEASTSVSVTANRNGEWFEHQPAWETLTAAQWPDYRGSGWLSAVHEEDRSELQSVIRTAGSELGSAQVRILTAPENEWRWFAVRTVMIQGPRGGFDDRVMTFADIHERKLARERQELQLGDLRHRLKNLVAVIHSLLTSSLPRNDPASALVAEKFMARLRAIENAGDLIMAANWLDVDMRAVVETVLQPFIEAHRSRFSMTGPALPLHEHTAGGIALACHELATNALKYGALSIDGGLISIAWSINRVDGDDEEIVWQWQERNGPRLVPPEREGFGLRVIRSAVVRERDNTVDIEFRPDGLECRMRFLRSRTPSHREALHA